MEVDRAVIFSEIPRNSSLILEEKENLKKILEEKKIPRFRPLANIIGVSDVESCRESNGTTQGAENL